MAYKIEVCVDVDNDTWAPVIDLKLSKNDKSVPRIFLEETAAKYFAEENVKHQWRLVEIE